MKVDKGRHRNSPVLMNKALMVQNDIVLMMGSEVTVLRNVEELARKDNETDLGHVEELAQRYNETVLRHVEELVQRDSEEMVLKNNALR